MRIATTLFFAALSAATASCATGEEPGNGFPVNLPDYNPSDSEESSTSGGLETSGENTTAEPDPTTGMPPDDTTTGEGGIDPYGPCALDGDCDVGSSCIGPVKNMGQVAGSFCAPPCKESAECPKAMNGDNNVQCLLGPSEDDPMMQKYCAHVCTLGDANTCGGSATCDPVTVWPEDSKYGLCSNP